MPTRRSSARREDAYYRSLLGPGVNVRWYSHYAIFGALVLLFVSVWAKGLFFNYAALLTTGFAFIGLGFLTGRLDRRGWLVVTPWLLAELGYLLALTHAVAIGQAEQGVFLHLVLAVFAAAGVILADDVGNVRRLLGWFGALAALLAFAVPLSQARWIQVPGAIFAPDRWATAFQYPDTAGAVFGAGFFALMLYRPNTVWEIGIKRGGQVISGAALVLSLSRGADLVMPVGLLAAILVVARLGEWTLLLNELAGGAFGGLVLSLLWRGTLPGREYAPLLFLVVAFGWAAAWLGAEWLWNRRRWPARESWAVVLAFVVVVAALGALAVRHKSAEPVVATPSKPYKISTTHPAIGGTIELTANAPVTLALVAESRYDNPTTLASLPIKRTGSVRIPPLGKGNQALAVTVTPASGTAALDRLDMVARTGATTNLLPWFVHVLPESIYSRILEVNGRQLSIWQRGVFVANGMTMAANRPLLGYGAAGWANDYRAFQTLPYTSREVHNGWVQWWIDGGALAGIGFGLLLVGLAYGVWRARRLPRDRRWAAAGLAAASTVLLAHSTVDWDLSFVWDEMLIAVLWGAFIAASLRTETVKPVDRTRAAWSWPQWTAAAISVGVGIFTLNLAQGQGYVEAADQALSQQSAQKNPVAFYKRLLTKDSVALKDQPNLGPAVSLKAEILAYLSTQKTGGTDFAEANQAYQEAVAVQPTSGALRVSYGDYLVTARQYSAALPQFSAAVRLAPMKTTSVEGALQGDYNVAVDALTQNDKTLAIAAFAGLRRSLAFYEHKAATIPEGMIPSLQLPALTGGAQLAQGIDELAAGRTAAAKKTFGAIQPSTLAGTGQAWLEIVGVLHKPKLWAKMSTLGTVAKNLIQWGIVK